ncbi:OHCU decarboxylase-domain-containing protein [Daedaleopsis nitida]|nr:OHCU decarboxylase-domain-containing protein [Daedaleopsis nitida]
MGTMTSPVYHLDEVQQPISSPPSSASEMRSWVHSVKSLGTFGSLPPPSTLGARDTASTLPSLLEAISDTSGSPSSPLATALAVLFEPSPILYTTLVPALAARIQAGPPPTSYYALIDAALAEIASWPHDRQAEFIAGHPRIGEVNGLSKLSAQEQAAKATPPEVLARLAHLNACYERQYPGLVYITYVNGRSRADIKDEMEDKLGFEHSVSADEPAVETVGSVDVGGQEWKSELERAVHDVGKIAKSRLGALGAAEVEG